MSSLDFATVLSSSPPSRPCSFRSFQQTIHHLHFHFPCLLHMESSTAFELFISSSITHSCFPLLLSISSSILTWKSSPAWLLLLSFLYLSQRAPAIKSSSSKQFIFFSLFCLLFFCRFGRSLPRPIPPCSSSALINHQRP